MVEERKEWIIAVDDDPGLLDPFKRILTRRYRVSLFSTPAEALEAIRTEGCPDLVITDQRMPVRQAPSCSRRSLRFTRNR